MSLGIDTRLLGRVLDAVLAAVHNRPNKAEEEHSENYAKNNRPEDVTIHLSSVMASSERLLGPNPATTQRQ